MDQGSDANAKANRDEAAHTLLLDGSSLTIQDLISASHQRNETIVRVTADALLRMKKNRIFGEEVRGHSTHALPSPICIHRLMDSSLSHACAARHGDPARPEQQGNEIRIETCNHSYMRMQQPPEGGVERWATRCPSSSAGGGSSL